MKNNVNNEVIDKALQEKIIRVITNIIFDKQYGYLTKEKADKYYQQIIHTVTQHNVKEYRERLIDKIQTEDRLDWKLSIEEINQIIQEVIK